MKPKSFVKKSSLLACLILGISTYGLSQTDSLKVSAGIYSEWYYVQAEHGQKSPIFYNHTTTQQPALNLGILDFAAERKRWSLQSAFMLGTYAQKNLAAEPEFWRHVYQLSIQYQLNQSNQLQVGIFPSHIGLESAKNIDNDLFSRSYLAENSPYYETGIAWNYTPKSPFSMRVLALSGWQQMAKFNPALGTQFGYSSSSGLKINASQFLGNQGKGTRVFFNQYVQIPISANWSGTMGWDVGLESGNIWHGGLMYLTWRPATKLRLSGRVEYYSDPRGVIMPTAFEDVARSLAIDYTVNKKILLRSEAKNSNKFGSEILFGLIFNATLAAKYQVH